MFNLGLFATIFKEVATGALINAISAPLVNQFSLHLDAMMYDGEETEEEELCGEEK